MNYFTKEELREIADELLMNPTRETLNRLNEKYNGSNSAPKTLVEETKPVEEPAKPAEMAPSASMDVPNLGAPNLNPEVSPAKVEAAPFNGPTIPSLDMPNFDNSNMSANATTINVTGNPWDNQAPQVPNMTATTDNFNNPASATNIPINGAQFFETNNQMTNPAPMNSQAPQGPTIFSQLEQNYTGQQ